MKKKTLFQRVLIDAKLSNVKLNKYIQIFSFLAIFLFLSLLFIDMIWSMNVILSFGDMSNEIGTKINNNVNLQGHVHVHVNDKEAGKSIATQLGITGAMFGGALGVGKAIAKSPMPPIQKAGTILGVSLLAGAGQVGLSLFSGALSKNTSTSITTSATSNSINKFISDSEYSPLQGILYSLEIMDYSCLTILYILIIQLVYKLYLKDNIRLNIFKVLSENFNNKVEFYLNKIIKLNKQMSVFWIWLIFAVVLYIILVSIYLTNGVFVNLDHFINLHNCVNNNVVPTIYESIQVSLYNLAITNYIYLIIIIGLAVLLLSKFYFNKNVKSIYIFILIIMLIIALGFSVYVLGELHTNLDSYVNMYNINK